MPETHATEGQESIVIIKSHEMYVVINGLEVCMYDLDACEPGNFAHFS